jgi:hypothetical protein
VRALFDKEVRFARAEQLCHYIYSYGMSYQQQAVDTQFFISLTPHTFDTNRTMFEGCVMSQFLAFVTVDHGE